MPESPVSIWSRMGTLAPILTFIFIAAVYFATFFSLWPNLPIIERMAEDIPGFEQNYPPFRVDEKVYYDISRHILDGTLYRGADAPERAFTLGFPLVAAPFVAIFGNRGGYAANLLIILGALAVFYLILHRYGFRRRAMILTLIMAFASLDWFYAISNYSEPLSQLLVLVAFALLFRRGGTSGADAAILLSGAFTALNLFVRPHFILLAVPFFIGLAFERGGKPGINRRAILYAAGTAAVVVIWAVRNQLVFGAPLTFEYSRLTGSFTPGAASAYMKGNIFLGIHRLLFDQYHGLFTITPICLLFPAGLRAMWQRGLKTESLVLLGAVTLAALFIASGPYPFTEFGLGSRHMVPIMPLMLLPAAFFLDGRLFTGSVTALVAVYSFYMAGVGWFTGGEPGMGFFLGILNEAQSRAVVLARKDMLPKKHFASQKDLVDSYLGSLKKADIMGLLQTMDPEVIGKIRGHEREFMIILRNQPDPRDAILSADPAKGIIIKSFSVSGGFEEQRALPDSASSP
jgi:hypothetical protein